MRTQHRIGFLALLGTLIAVPAHAASVSNFSVSGTGGSLSTGTTDSTGCVTIFVSLDASTGLTRADGTTSKGSAVTGDIQLFNSCTGVNEFGSIFAEVGNGFSAKAQTGTLTATVVVTMFQFDADFNFIGTIDRTLVANRLTWTSDPTETFVAQRHTRETFPGSKSVSNGHSTQHIATISGALTVDGQNVLFPGAFALFETSMFRTISLTTN